MVLNLKIAAFNAKELHFGMQETGVISVSVWKYQSYLHLSGKKSKVTMFNQNPAFNRQRAAFRAKLAAVSTFRRKNNSLVGFYLKT